tara:strand:+ start:1166 stop:1639 length:474 start_codon:yes stop_codon:yes gene_type:complete
MTKHIFKIIIVVIFLSCSSNNTYNKYIEIENKNWSAEKKIVFEIPELKKNKQYNYEIKLRHTTEYKYQNLYIFLNLIYKNQQETQDTIEIILAEKNGKWKGFGVGYVREQKHKINSVIDHENLKEINIEQAMRYGEQEKIDFLSEVIALGMTINEKK